MEEKFGTILIDGEVINIDKLSLEELNKLKNKVNQQESEIREKIDKILNN